MMSFPLANRFWHRGEWQCVGCGRWLKKVDAYNAELHAPDCDWASMIPTNLSGHRDA